MMPISQAALLLLLSPSAVKAFAPQPPTFGSAHWHLRTTTTTTQLEARRTIPLLDLSGSDIEESVIVPLPSSHLPDELTTLNLYGMELSRPVHKMMIREAIQKGDNAGGGDGGSTRERAYGHIVSKESDDTLVGAVGCAAEVLIQAARRDGVEEESSELGMDASVAVLYRGCYRFIVREVIKTIPYPVAIVDDLVDDETSADEPNNELEGDEDDLEFYASMSVGELNRRIMHGVKSFIDFKVHEAKNTKVSPLERSIVEDTGLLLPSPEDQNNQAEEAAAVFDIFSSSLADIAPTPKEQSFAIAMMAAEICDFDNAMRTKLLQMTNAVMRLQLVCQTVEEIVGRSQALKITKEITEPVEDEKELQVGPPQLPPWAAQIKKGTRVEYYWNEEWEWAPGEVIQDPVKIMDEYLLNIKFDADGEVHTLPLNADDKMRWRPGKAKEQ